MRAFNAFLAVATTQLLFSTTMHRGYLSRTILSDNDSTLASIDVPSPVEETTRSLTRVVEETGNFDGFNTPSVQCRLGMEQWQNDNIDRWMLNPETPLVEWVWELQDEEQRNRTYYRGLLGVLFCGEGTCTPKRAQQIASYEWTWQDQSGGSHKVSPGALEISNLEFAPRIYFRLDPPEPHTIPKFLFPKLKNGTTPIVYDLEPFLRCNKAEQQNPPPPKAKIGACVTRFWGQHDLVPEWIAYHRMIGIEHFWFFVSEPFDNIKETMPRQERDISYIPYNYTWEGHKHNGNIDMITTPGGWSGAGGENWFQNKANNQCLYLAKQYGFDWIIMPDVDEYIAIHDPEITHFSNPSPLQQYFQKYHSGQATNTKKKAKQQHKLEGSQVCLHGGGYGRHPDEDESKFQLNIDFTWRKDKKYGNGEGFYNGNGGAHGRKKCFYNPHMVTDVGIHSALGVAGRGYVQNSRKVEETVTAANSKKIELFHFRSPMVGPTNLPGVLRGKKKIPLEQLANYPQVRDMYREKVMDELKRLNWTLPHFGKHKCMKYKC